MLHIPQAQTRATITPMVASVNQDIDITDYTTAKLAEGFQVLGLANTAIRGVAAAIVDAGDAPLSYAHPVLSGSDDTRLKLRLRCAIDELNAASPLLPGETLLQDRFAFSSLLKCSCFRQVLTSFVRQCSQNRHARNESD